MIPTTRQIKKLWDMHRLPAYKRSHCQVVARLALWFARQLKKRDPALIINTRLLNAAALLHDLDKMAQKQPNEHHPDAVVRILRAGDFHAVADLVRTHPLHAILDQSIAPKTWEQKLLYLADKMVKHTIITVDERFVLWRSEKPPPEIERQLDEAYPKVKALEKEICTGLCIAPQDVARLANKEETSTMMLPDKGGTPV